nr:translation initiation factor IF-2-like [Aegilops tauschii subsp. strangulata]
MPTFDGRGLVPPVPSEASVVMAPVMVSSDDSDEEEGLDSEATREGAGQTSPRARPISYAPCLTTTTLETTRPTLSAKKKREGAAAPSGTQQPGMAAPPPAQKSDNSPRASPARSFSRGLEERPQEGATSTAAPASEAPALSSPAEAPQALELPASSSTAIDSQILATMLPPSFITPPARDPSTSPDALEKALSALTRLRDDLQGADRRLVAGRLELISGWIHSDASVRAALGQAVAASEEDKRAADQAAAAHKVALKDAEAAKERCRSMEAELETMHNERPTEARDRKVEEEKMKAREDAVNGRDTKLEQSTRAQAAECSCLEKLEKKVEAKRAQLEAKARVLAEDRAAFKSLEERARVALWGLYEKGLKKLLATNDEGPAQLLPHLIAALKDVVDRIGLMVEGEARALSSSALTHVFSHLHLHNPNADLGELLEPVEEGCCTAAAEAVKGQVEALLKKFLAIEPTPPAVGAADPATKASDTSDGDAAEGKALPDDGAQG